MGLEDTDSNQRSMADNMNLIHNMMFHSLSHKSRIASYHIEHPHPQDTRKRRQKRLAKLLLSSDQVVRIVGRYFLVFIFTGKIKNKNLSMFDGEKPLFLIKI